MKLQLERDIVEEVNDLIDNHVKKGGRRINRIDLDDYEWLQFMSQGPRLLQAGILRADHWHNDPSDYYYRDIEIVKRSL